MNLSRRTILIFVASLALLAIVIGSLSVPALERFHMRQQAEKSVAPLRLAAESLRAALDRYAPLPALIAERSSLSRLLSDPTDLALQATVKKNY